MVGVLVVCKRWAFFSFLNAMDILIFCYQRYYGCMYLRNSSSMLTNFIFRKIPSLNLQYFSNNYLRGLIWPLCKNFSSELTTGAQCKTAMRSYAQSIISVQSIMYAHNHSQIIGLHDFSGINNKKRNRTAYSWHL